MMFATREDRRQFLQLSLIGAAGLLDVSATAHGAENVRAASHLYLAIYRPGPNWRQGQPTSAQPLREHGRHMLDLHRRGRLRLAGSFADDDGGAAAFEAESDEAAQAVIDADPAVVSGIMVCDLRRWKVLDWDEVRRRADAKA